MAKENSIEEQINQLYNNFNSIIEKSVKAARKDVKQDLDEYAKKVVDRYYQYKKGQYTRHKRKYRLYDLYKTTVRLSHPSEDIYVFNLNIKFDPKNIEGVHSSRNTSRIEEGFGTPWKSGGNVEADYVFNNFWHSKHPWTVFSSDPEVSSASYRTYKQKPSSKEYIEKYMKNYGEKMMEIIWDNIIKNIM